MTPDTIENLEMLAKRRDRAIASILGFKEAECDRYLPDQIAQRLRKIVLDQINDLYVIACSGIRSDESGGVIFNDLYLQKLTELHEKLVLGA